MLAQIGVRGQAIVAPFASATASAMRSCVGPGTCPWRARPACLRNLRARPGCWPPGNTLGADAELRFDRFEQWARGFGRGGDRRGCGNAGHESSPVMSRVGATRRRKLRPFINGTSRYSLEATSRNMEVMHGSFRRHVGVRRGGHRRQPFGGEPPAAHAAAHGEPQGRRARSPLDAKLLVRGTRKLALTDVGEAYLHAAGGFSRSWRKPSAARRASTRRRRASCIHRAGVVRRLHVVPVAAGFLAAIRASICGSCFRTGR